MSESSTDLIDLDSLAEHGIELYGQDQQQEAIDIWQDIIQMEPDHLPCQNYLKIALINLSSETTLNQSIPDTVSSEESFNEIYFSAMKAYTHRNYSEAEALFKQCLVIQPDDTRAQHNLNRLQNR